MVNSVPLAATFVIAQEKDDNPLNVKLNASRMKEGAAEFQKAFPAAAKNGGNRGAARGQQRLEEIKKTWMILDAAAKGAASAAPAAAKKPEPRAGGKPGAKAAPAKK